MKRSLFKDPSATTASPMLSILPSVGSVQELEKYSSSFFARAEKVAAMREAASHSDESDRAVPLVREEEMLKEVLAWISGRPEEA